jgi:DNA-binding MarR family transcriptional regulator
MSYKIDHPAPPSLVAQIGSLYHMMQKECDKIFRENNFPLQMDQIPVLMILYYSGGASQKYISASLGRDKASINRTISVLLKKDLVKVIPDAIDKRKTHVVLTGAGEKLAKQADIILGKFDALLSSALTEEERKELDKTMPKLIGVITPC